MATNTITADEQFLVYWDKLRREVDRAYMHYQICKTLRELSVTRGSDFSQAAAFFRLTIQANLFATVMSINRFTDKGRDSLHLDTFLRFAKLNLELFSTQAFKRRLHARGEDAEYCDHFSRRHRAITADVVKQDATRTKTLPLNRLRKWRDKMLAHTEKKPATENVDIMKENPVTVKDIDDILNTFHEILSRYRLAYDGTSRIPGLSSLKPEMEYVMDAISSHRRPIK